MLTVRANLTYLNKMLQYHLPNCFHNIMVKKIYYLNTMCWASAVAGCFVFLSFTSSIPKNMPAPLKLMGIRYNRFIRINFTDEYHLQFVLKVALPDVTNYWMFLFQFIEAFHTVITHFDGIFPQVIILNYIHHSQGHCTWDWISSILQFNVETPIPLSTVRSNSWKFKIC